jgi:uncharacterized protein (TIGR04255 family)
MQITTSTLPDFNNPPVNEVVFGIQFKKLQNLKVPHTGILWEKLGRKEYPECKEMPPISHTVESFEGIHPQPPSVTIERLTNPPLPRLFFISAIKNHLIQIQEDRLHHNWRKVKSDDEYPRYAKLYPKFVRSWELFTAFADELELGPIEPDQYELTYVNHIPRGEGWVDLIDIHDVFRDFQYKTEGRFLGEPENMSWRKTYRLPNDAGRLHVSVRLAVSRESKDQLMIMDLTARGFVADKMETWFSIAHEWIVKGFTDLTSESIQKSIWKKKR